MMSSSRDDVTCSASDFGRRFAAQSSRTGAILHAMILVLLLGRGVASGNRGDGLVSGWRELPLDNFDGPDVLSGTLSPGTWDRFEVTHASGDSCRSRGFDHITFRVWDMDRVRLQNETSSTSASHGADALLIAGAGSSYLTTWKDTAPAFVSASENFWAVGTGLHADFTGFQILRPYHSVVRPLEDPSSYSVAVYNVDEWVQTNLDYVLSAECSGSLGSCVRPAGPDGPICSGLGLCGSQTGVCHCDNGRGGIGCEYPVQELLAGDDELPLLIGGGKWKHFVYYAAHNPLDGDAVTTGQRRRVTVQMSRVSGQTVLFVKKRTEGQSPYGMINIYDYNNHADVESNTLRLSEHSRSFIIDDECEGGADSEDCVYYISIFNNGNAIYGAGSANVSVTETLEDATEPSPNDSGDDSGGSTPTPTPGDGGDPSPYTPLPVDVDNIPALPSTPFTTCANTPCFFGHCVDPTFPSTLASAGAQATCVCTPGYAGHSCNTLLHTTMLGESQSGTIPGGMWKYYVMKLGINSAADGSGVHQPFPNDLLVTFKQYGGQAILVAKLGTSGDLPDTQTNDYLFTTPYYNPHIEQFKIGSHNLYMGNYVFGVHNAGGVGSQMNYVLKIEVTRDDSWFPKSMMHLAIGVFAAFCLLILFIIYKKVMYRNANMTIVQAVINAVTLSGGRQQQSGNHQRQGLELAEIQNMSMFTYTSGTDIKGGEQCMVCLCDFEEGDELRLMPVCGHAFHAKCVDPWLQQNHTCPTCRQDLVETGSDANAGSGEVGGAVVDAQTPERTDPSVTDGLATPDGHSGRGAFVPGVQNGSGDGHSGAGDVLVTISDIEEGASGSTTLSSSSTIDRWEGGLQRTAVDLPPVERATVSSPRRLTPPGTPDQS